MPVVIIIHTHISSLISVMEGDLIPQAEFLLTITQELQQQRDQSVIGNTESTSRLRSSSLLSPEYKQIQQLDDKLKEELRTVTEEDRYLQHSVGQRILTIVSEASSIDPFGDLFTLGLRLAQQWISDGSLLRQPLLTLKDRILGLSMREEEEEEEEEDARLTSEEEAIADMIQRSSSVTGRSIPPPTTKPSNPGRSGNRRTPRINKSGKRRKVVSKKKRLTRVKEQGAEGEELDLIGTSTDSDVEMDEVIADVENNPILQIVQIDRLEQVSSKISR